MRRWIILIAAFSISCGKDRAGFHPEQGEAQAPPPHSESPVEQSPPAASDPNASTPINPKTGTIPLPWESIQPKMGKAWTDFVYRLLKNEAKSLVDRADDMDLFCPKFDKLTLEQKLNAVGLLISAMVRFESNFDPIARMKEGTMGTDPVTGQNVYSEGLLQLSYQDTLTFRFCEFDWKADKKLAATDPRKTIFNPEKNLSCGIRILADQVDRYRSLVIDNGAYWAVIKKNGKFQKIQKIAAIVQTLPACR